MTGREKRTSQWQIFDVHNGLMSAFDRDIGGRRVTLCALAWPRGFCCHSWWQWLSPCRLNWCLQICPGCTFFPPLGSTGWWWVADETNRSRHWCLRFHHTEPVVAYQASCTATQCFPLRHRKMVQCYQLLTFARRKKKNVSSAAATSVTLMLAAWHWKMKCRKFNINSQDVDSRLQPKVP